MGDLDHYRVVHSRITIGEADRAFALAPMCGLMRALTIGVLCLPIAMIGLAWHARGPVALILAGVAGLLLALDAYVWHWLRPNLLLVDDEQLIVLWPLRHLHIPWAELRSVRALGSGAQLRRELGWGGRIGVGGLWGAFGMLWTSKKGLVDLYVSRLDGWVWLERRQQRPLILSPERPDAFIAAVRRRLQPETNGAG